MSFSTYNKNLNKFPGGVYISVKMTSTSYQKLLQYKNAYLPEIKFNEDQHCTLIYSKKPLNISPILPQYSCKVSFKGFSLFGPNKDTLVAEVKSAKLTYRNKKLVQDYGFVSDYSEYKPHFTLGYEAKDVDLSKLPPIDFPIEFENETVENLDLSWSK